MKAKFIYESLEDVLKPKSEEEIKDLLKDIDYEQYEEYIADNLRMNYEDIDYGDFRSLIEKGFKEQIPPPQVVKEIVELYYDMWEPSGVLQLTNTGGIEVKLLDSSDAIEYRFTGQKIPKTAELDYRYIDTEEEADELGAEVDDVIAYFEDDHGNIWYLNNFMRV